MTIKELNKNIFKTSVFFLLFFLIILYLTNYFILSFISSIFFIELVYGSWVKKNNFTSIIIPRNITKVWKPSHYKAEHAAMYKRDEFGLRGDYKNISDIYVATIGGSTTDERWIDEKLTWSHLLQNNLNNYGINIKIANAGVDGQSTLGHIYNFDFWFNKIPNFKPKFFILLLGINDSAVLMRDLDSNIIEKFLYRSDFLMDKKISQRIIRYIKNNSFIYKNYKIKKGHQAALKYNLIHSTKTWEERKQTVPFKVENDYITQKYLKDYVSRLDKLIVKVLSFGSIPIIVTQNTSNHHFLYNCLKLINIETKRYCKKNYHECLCLDERINFLDEDFYDGIHTRPSGNLKISEYIFNKIKDKIDYEKNSNN